MSQQPLNILISGAGIAGASLAFTLARQPGFKVQPSITVIEKSPVPRTTGQAVDIRGPGVDVITRLGLEPEIKAMHTTETGVSFLNSKGDTAATFSATGDAKNQSASSEYEILRGDLARLLLDGVNTAKERGAKVDVVYGESIDSMKERGDGSGVDVYFTNGKISNQKFDAVIGCDGISSSTRNFIFGKADLKEHIKPSGLYIAFFSIPRIPEDDSLWRWCQIPPGLGMHLRPHCNKETMGVYLTICNTAQAYMPEIEDVIRTDVATQKKYLRQRFHNAGWQSERFLDGLDTTNDFYMSHWCQVVTPKYAKGHCVILGDAAFATMGVGTSLAMTGAYCIAGELSKIESPDQVPDALQKYEDLFRPWVEKHQISYTGGMQLANPQTAWGVWLFQNILKVVTMLKLPQLLMRFFGGEGKNTWKLPDYGW
ncbi:FAD/NAD(P)-binding domain-containing protein [Didymella exigua CBS 183.55]|uniref:FAD/NAD(P)-binding domain-containing protein n=1 Tax=Didymella exigua CBS 183.55 TaxID=1150837 RepID=A0A6A5RGQ6_9PLEO|nr:FAD/NAD(P)-binding domain-containing protein [Didymella exigua CBS 183.55]KAF1926318.1 FAD/NAD(P)-binding domain-containing protein [Didymella exigua CBS 183.55]